MNKKIKLKIVKRALDKHNFGYDLIDDIDTIDNLDKIVDDVPAKFINTCIEEAYKEGKKDALIELESKKE